MSVYGIIFSAVPAGDGGIQLGQLCFDHKNDYGNTLFIDSYDNALKRSNEWNISPHKGDGLSYSVFKFTPSICQHVRKELAKDRYATIVWNGAVSISVQR